MTLKNPNPKEKRNNLLKSIILVPDYQKKITGTFVPVELGEF